MNTLDKEIRENLIRALFPVRPTHMSHEKMQSKTIRRCLERYHGTSSNGAEKKESKKYRSWYYFKNAQKHTKRNGN